MVYFSGTMFFTKNNVGSLRNIVFLIFFILMISLLL